ncbi:MAG: DUF2490 domain-containing protein [Bacteroidales bacterium]|nr:DUF2490 domain-containing protein [Bacteroidales bacterium]
MKETCRLRAKLTAPASLSFLLLGLLMLPLMGQSQQVDSRMRAGLILSGDLGSKFKGRLGLEQRFKDNLHQYDRFLLEPEISYEASNSTEISWVYRGSLEQEEGRFVWQNRIGMAGSWWKNCSDWRIKYTLSSQYSLPDYDEPAAFYNHFVLRNKLAIRYAIFGTRFSPEFKAELFTSFENKQARAYQLRTSLQLNYRLTRNSSLELYIMYDDEFQVFNPEDALILGFTFNKNFLFN